MALAGLVGIRLLTQLASPSVYGGVALLLGITSLGLGVFVGPVKNAQLRFDPEHVRNERIGWFTHQIQRYAWGATGLFMLTGCAAYAIWTAVSSSRFRPLLLVLLVMFTGLQTAKAVRLNRLNAGREQTWAFGWLGTEAWLLVIFPAGALILHSSVALYLAGLVAGSLIALLLFGRRHQPPIHNETGTLAQRRQLRNAITRYGLPFVPIAIFSWAHNLGDRYLVGAFLGADHVGQYVAAYGIASQPFILLGSAGTSLLRPILFEASAEKDHAKTKRVFRRWLLAVGLAGVLGVSLIAVAGHWIADLFLAAPYRATAVSVMLWIGAGYALMIVGQTLEHGLMVRNMTGRLVVPTAASALVNIALNLVLIPRWGLVGAAVATTAAFALQVLLLAGALIIAGEPGPGPSMESGGAGTLPWPFK